MSTTADGPAAFCDRVRDRLVGALTLATGDHGIGEELAQETLIRVWRQWSTVRTMDAPEAWAFRVGLNLSTSWHRRRLAEWRANRRSRPVDEPSAGDDHALVQTVRRAVAELPERQRAVVVARYYLGHDVAATAELLECAEGTVKAATSHALENLRRSGLVDEHDAEEAAR